MSRDNQQAGIGSNSVLVHVPVYKDRTRETIGTLYNNKHEPLFHFKARTHGVGTQNEFCGNGNTPTGLGLFDLNSPEDDPKSFGPYPVNRIVQGLKGNQALLLHNDVHTVRNGILLHTGNYLLDYLIFQRRMG